MTNERSLNAPPQSRLDQSVQLPRPHRDTRALMTRLGFRALATVIGAAVWTVGVVIIVLGPRNPGNLLVILLCLPLIGAMTLAMKGWSWYSQYELGTYGHFFKFLALMGIAFTGVGLVPICYWTGNAILQGVSENLL